jgi:CRP-like cAMP-binding protein
MKATERLLQKLKLGTALDADDAEAIKRLPVIVKELAPHTAIVREGERPHQCCLLVEGFLCRSKTTDAGKRQILSVHIPGEVPDLQSLYLHVLDHDLTTQSRSVVAFIPHEPLRALTRERPSVGGALWRETLIDAALFREWIVNVGRRTAVVRLAHLLAEIGTRLQAMGLASEDRFELPMTQLDIADALGLTPVHVNRVVGQLRRAGLLELRKQSVFLPDLPRLRERGEFDDLYLHRSKTS